MGYLADGEANDYIMKQFNIPSVSPELGNDNIFSGEFFLPYAFVSREVLRDNHPWIKYTINKLSGEITVSNKNQSMPTIEGNNYKFAYKVRNSGLQDMQDTDAALQGV